MRVLIIKEGCELVKATDISYNIPVAGDFLVIKNADGKPRAYMVESRTFGNVTDAPRQCVRLFVKEAVLCYGTNREKIEAMEREYCGID